MFGIYIMKKLIKKVSLYSLIVGARSFTNSFPRKKMISHCKLVLGYFFICLLSPYSLWRYPMLGTRKNLITWLPCIENAYYVPGSVLEARVPNLLHTCAGSCPGRSNPLGRGKVGIGPQGEKKKGTEMKSWVTRAVNAEVKKHWILSSIIWITVSFTYCVWSVLLTLSLYLLFLHLPEMIKS